MIDEIDTAKDEGVMSGVAFSAADAIRLLTIEECQAIGSPLREELEVLDYEVRAALIRVLSDVEASGADGVLFLKASMTVLLSIAAGMLARASEERNVAVDIGSFTAGAQAAAEWARMRKLRYFVSGEA